jgi:RHS repeat-associated protein
LIPAGRNGFQPHLNLVYSSGGGNGPFGLDWNIGIPEVNRKTSSGIPRYVGSPADVDTFVLSGAEDLVPVGQIAPGMTLYRPRTEGLFAHIEHHHDRGQSFWRVLSKDGVVSTFGTERPPDAAPDWQDEAVVADPNARGRIFSWKLTRTEDPFGNRIDYGYERDREQGSRCWDQLYLKQIHYVDYRDENGELSFLVSVSLDYGDTSVDRSDSFSSRRAGFEIRTRRLCKRILVRTHAGQDRLVRSYRFRYETAEHNRVSLLSEVEVFGGDDAERLPPLRFNYSRFEPEGRTFDAVQGRELPEQSLSGDRIELVDLFGNGLPDLLELNGTIRYWRNLGGGRFDLPRLMREAPAGLDLADRGVQLIDADGDGRIDLATYADEVTGFFPLRLSGEWDQRSFQRQRFAPSFSLSDPEVQLIDLDGDGVTDAIRAGSRLELFFNHRREGWHETRQVERQALVGLSDLTFTDVRVRWADLSGDGLQDLVLVHDGSVEYWPSFGYGTWGERILMSNSPRLPSGYNPRRLMFGDLDGDGLADLVYVDDYRVFLWINQGGNGWSDPIVIDGTPPMHDFAAVRLVDLLGSGIVGLLWSFAADASARERMYFLDFTGARKPYLLIEMDNQAGAITQVEYAPSTRFYLQDQTNPAMRWRTPLPFPVQVVARVQVLDVLSGGKLTTEYRYHHGYWDGAEREFRGFGQVEQFDSESFSDYHAQPFGAVPPIHFSPPTMTRSWFHLGPVGEETGDWHEPDWSADFWPGDPPQLQHRRAVDAFLRALPNRRARRDALRALRGSVLRTELYALDGSDKEDRPYTVTESAYGLREEAPPDQSASGRRCIFFPHALVQRTTQWERGDDPMTRFEFKRAYDAFGQPLEQLAIACPRGWRTLEDRVSPETPFLATYTQTEYATAAGDEPYIRDRVARTTTFELKQRSEQTVLELAGAIADPAVLELSDQTLTYYDGEPFTGLPFGLIGAYGAPVRSEQLACTEEALQKAYGSGPANGVDGIPPYLVPGGAVDWTTDYPQSFRERLPELAGYTFFDGSGPQARGFFISSGLTCLDVQVQPGGRGMPLATRDAMGAETTVAYDRFHLLPQRVTDPLGMTTSAEYDYRVLQPFLSVDQNGNRIHYSFSGLGFLTAVAVLGKEGETIGDSVEVPGIRLEYDFLAFANSLPQARQPISVRTIQRAHHVHDEVQADLKDEVIIRVEYSDGFGRLIQRRVQAEDALYGNDRAGTDIIPVDQQIAPGPSVGRRRGADDLPNVLVTGWQVFDNKGQVVRQYEPFFAAGFGYVLPGENQLGQQSQMFYDPRGEVVRTVHPNGSIKRVIFGVPRRLDTPDDHLPTPWEAYTYDTNDNAGSFSGEHRVDPSHWNTPASIVVDALGRVIAQVSHLGEAADQKLFVHSEHDLRGRLISVTDPAGRVAFRYVYGPSGAGKASEVVLREESLDAGPRRIVVDACGREIERRDAKGALILQAYDAAGRPTHLWAADEPGAVPTLRQRFVYGERAGLTDPEAANLKGRPYQHFDEAGVLEFSHYDFKGNLTRQSRQVIADSAILAVMGHPEPTRFRLDWERPDALDSLGSSFQTDMAYDALNRLRSVTYPQDVNGDRKVLVPSYNRAGALERIALLSENASSEQVFVRRIAYDARGQRSLIAYGNGWMSRYAYDPKTFRLARLRTERYQQTSELELVPVGGLLQDFGYLYDLTGNLVELRDRSPSSGVPGTPIGSNALDREFAYDPLNQLVRATGREHIGRDPSSEPWQDGRFHTSQDPTQTRPYSREYRYDVAGNLLELRHQTPSSIGSFNRHFGISAVSNRLAHFQQGGTYICGHDANGNLIQHSESQFFSWNHSDRMDAFRIQAGAGPASIEAVYLYDSLGQRVKKVVRHQGGTVEATTYIGNSFEHHVAGGQQNNLLHLMDDERRIASLRIGPALSGDASPALQYELADHLGSSVLTGDGTGEFVRREEFYPYGDTSFGSFARKRYRFTGRERDGESGLSYHRSRYYAPWLTRWISPDPAGRSDGLNVYRYARSNPLCLVDPEGTSAFGAVWDFAKGFGKFQWTGNFSVGGYDVEAPVGRNPFDWQMEAFDIIWDHTKKIWSKTKAVANTVWNWAKGHKALATMAGIGATALLTFLGYYSGKWILNWVLAPAVRIGTNAAFGYAMWGKAGAWVGAATGAIHGFWMAKAGTYKSAVGWLTFILDNSWSLFNSFVGSFFAAVNAPWNGINSKDSKDISGLYFNTSWIGNAATTFGNVTVGKQVPRHEAVHAWQGRLLGPLYIPLAILGYEVATVLPYWLIYKDCKLGGFAGYFTKGVYPNTWHEAMAFGFEGGRCNL